MADQGRTEKRKRSDGVRMVGRRLRVTLRGRIETRRRGVWRGSQEAERTDGGEKRRVVTTAPSWRKESRQQGVSDEARVDAAVGTGCIRPRHGSRTAARKSLSPRRPAVGLRRARGWERRGCEGGKGRPKGEGRQFRRRFCTVLATWLCCGCLGRGPLFFFPLNH